MGRHETIDPAAALNRRAQAEGWPFRCDTQLEFERPELNALRDLWRSLAAGNVAPSRADFDARTLKPFLRNIAIIERVVTADKWRYRARLTGSAIVEIAGDNTGRFFDQCIAPEFLARSTVPYDTVLDSGTPLRVVSSFELPLLSYLGGESFFAPLADTHGVLTLVLTCVYFKPR
jgi:hypothetical protein